MIKTKMKRVTLHPILEDGSMDTGTNIYPKTLIDAIVDRSGLPVEIQEKLIAGKNITIENNIISATGEAGGSEVIPNVPVSDTDPSLTSIQIDGEKFKVEAGGNVTIPEYHWNTREELPQETLDDIFTNNYPFFKMFIEDDEGYEFSLLLTQATDLPGEVEVERKDKNYRLRSYICVFNTAEVENHGSHGSDDYDWGSEDYGSEDRPDGFRIDPNDEKELIIFYIAKVDGVDEYLYSIDDRELTVRANPGASTDDPLLTSIEIDGHTFRVGGGESTDVRSQQMTATIVIDPITNINGRRLSSYTYSLNTREGYKVIVLNRKNSWVDYETAKDYMEYMTGSRYVPTFDYEHPQNSIWIMADGSIWKPQWDDGWGMCLWSIPNPYLTNYELDTTTFDIENKIITVSSDKIEELFNTKPVVIKIDNNLEVYLHSGDLGDKTKEIVYTNLYANDDGVELLAIIFGYNGANYYSELEILPIGGGSVDIEYATNEDIDNMFIKYTKLYYDLGEGIRLSNQMSEVLSGNDWGTDIYADEPKYSVSAVSIIVNGRDISGDWLDSYGRYVYDSLTKSIFIPHVDKDIHVYIYSYNDPYYYWIDSTLENCMGEGFQKYVYMGSALSCNVAPEYGYTELEVQIQDNNYNDVTEQYYRWDENDRRGYIYIPSVYEPYHIYARGVKSEDIATIYTSLDNCYLTQNPGHINLGESWNSELHSNSSGWTEEPSFIMIIDGYEIDILNDKEHKYVYLEKGYYIISIPNVTGDIYITGRGYQDLVNVKFSLDHVLASNTESQITRYSSYYNRFEVEAGYEVVEIYAEMGGQDITSYIDNRGAGVYVIDLGQVDGDLYFRFTTQTSSVVPIEYLDIANNVFFTPEYAGTYGYNFDYNITQVTRGDTYFNTFRSNTPGTEVKMYVNDVFSTSFYLDGWDGTWYYYSITEGSVSGPIRFEFDKHYVNLSTSLNNCEVTTTNPERPVLNQGFSCMIMPTGPYNAMYYSVFIGQNEVTNDVAHVEDGNIYVNIPSAYDDIQINATYEYQPQIFNVNLNPDENIGYSQGSTTITEGGSYATTLWSAYEFSVTVETGGVTNYYAPEYDAGQWTLTINLTDIRDNVQINCISFGPHIVHINNIIGANGVTWSNDVRQLNRGDQYTNTFTGPAQFHVLVTTSDGSLIIDNDSYWNGSEYVYTVDITSLDTNINIAVGYLTSREVYTTNPLSNAQVGQSFNVYFISHYNFIATIFNNDSYEVDVTSMELAPGLQYSSYTIDYVNGNVSVIITSDAPITYQISPSLTRCSINPDPNGVKYSAGASYSGTITGDYGTTPVFCQVWMNGSDISSGTVIQSGNEYIISIPDIQGDITIIAQYDVSVVMHTVTPDFTNADFQGGPAGTITEVEDGQSLSTIIVPTFDSYNSSHCQVYMGGVDITTESGMGTVTQDGTNGNYIIYIPYVDADIVIECSYEN